MKKLTRKETIRLYTLAFGPFVIAGFIGTLFGGLTGACIGVALVIAVTILKPIEN